MRLRNIKLAVLFVIADITFAKVGNETTVGNRIEKLRAKLDQLDANETVLAKNPLKTRRRERSTSSSSGPASAVKKDGDSGQSLDLSESSITSSVAEPKKVNKYIPVSSEERKGWASTGSSEYNSLRFRRKASGKLMVTENCDEALQRKWHRKCTPCPEDMHMKWRDPRIKWICGAYQRARRSFKSLCMMHLRNCQDGTMFTKIHDHRCKNDTKQFGQHFFYDYFVKLTDDSSGTNDPDTSSDQEKSDSD